MTARNFGHKLVAISQTFVNVVIDQFRSQICNQNSDHNVVTKLGLNLLVFPPKFNNKNFDRIVTITNFYSKYVAIY